MKKILSTLAVLLLCSCGNAYYMGKAPSVPLLDERGDLQIGAGVGLSPLLFAGSAGIDVAYALTDHMAVQAVGQIYDDREDYYIHGAAGWYMPLPAHQQIELWAGAGKGLSIAGKGLTGSAANTTWFEYQQYFGSLNYGLKDLTRAHIDLGAGLRGGLMPYSLLSTGNESHAVEEEAHDATWFAEPQLFFRIGGDHVKFQLQIYYSTFNRNPELGLTHIVVSPINMSLGCTLHF